MILRFKGKGAPPQRASDQAAGYDLRAATFGCILPGKREIVETGFDVALPEGTVGLVCSRSGLAAKHGVFVLNAPGIIDEDYRGPLKVILQNSGDETFWYRAGDRIAQLVITPVLSPTVIKVEEFHDGTTRGAKGFGSTGNG